MLSVATLLSGQSRCLEPSQLEGEQASNVRGLATAYQHERKIKAKKESEEHLSSYPGVPVLH